MNLVDMHIYSNIHQCFDFLDISKTLILLCRLLTQDWKLIAVGYIVCIMPLSKSFVGKIVLHIIQHTSSHSDVEEWR